MALVQLAQDNFTRVNESPLNPANWSVAGSGNVALQVVSNKCEGTSAVTNNEEVWTGLVWPNDQASEVTIAADSATEIRVLVRASLVAETSYFGQIIGPLGASTAIKLFRVVAGTFTQIGVTFTGPVSVGDVIRVSAIGTTISVSQNGTALISGIDAGISSGRPGIFMAGAIGSTAVSLWTGYGIVTTPTVFNVWSPQGSVVSPTAGKIFANPNVIFDTNPVILTGNISVFKMWCSNVTTGGASYYFESTDGISWTPYASNPILVSNSLTRVFKVGSTYYLYSSTTFPATAIHVYTSTDGVTFTLQNSNAIVGGTAGAWDVNVYQLCLVDIINGTWYAYYNGENGPSSMMGLATSTDGINWTKSPSNPIITTLSSNFAFFKVGATYYGLFDGAPTNSQMLANSVRNIYMLSAPSVNGPWTELTLGGQAIPIYYASTPADFGSFNTDNAIGDPTICAANGNLYLYYTVSPHGTATGLNGAIAFNTTLSQLVSGYGGVVGAPISGAPNLNLVTLGSDTFQRANTNPIGGNWTTVSPGTDCQIVSNLAQPATGTVLGTSFWNPVVWGADQWAQVTASNVTSGSNIGVTLRANTSGSAIFYDFVWGGVIGASGSWFIQSRVNGVTTTLQTGTGLAVSLGDTIMGVVNGANLYFYWNGYLIGSAVNGTVVAGAPGLFLFSNGATSGAAVSAWSAGSFQSAPSLHFSCTDCRVPPFGPNTGVTVQGTIQYTKQTSSNSAIPPVDSRAPGFKPVDSRNPVYIRTNSRAPGTYGPGN